MASFLQPMQRFLDYKAGGQVDGDELVRKLQSVQAAEGTTSCDQSASCSANSTGSNSTTDESGGDADDADLVFHSTPSTPTSGRADGRGSTSPEVVDMSSTSSDGDTQASSSSGGSNSRRRHGTDSGGDDSVRRPFLPLAPLHLAAYEGNEQAVLRLLSSSADPHMRSGVKGLECSGLTPAEIALQRGNYAVAHLIDEFVRLKRGPVPLAADEVGMDADVEPMETGVDAEAGAGAKATRLVLGPNFGVGSEDGYKKPSEDRIVVMPLDIDDMVLYCIFDGHNGKQMSEAVSLWLPHKIKTALHELLKQVPSDSVTPEVIADLLERCFVLLDDEIVAQAQRNFMLRTGGTTAVVVVETKTHLICANVGDSPAAVFDATTGQMLAITEDHTPANPLELARVLSKGGSVVPNPDYGDMRMRSPSKRSTVSVTRAFGQFEFKAGLEPDEYVLTAKPQCYVWSKEEMRARTLDPTRARLFLTLYSDSFTEAVVDSFNVGDLAPGTRPPQVIANVVPHDLVLRNFACNLRNSGFHCAEVAQGMAVTQTLRFHIGGSFCGDNTSLILLSLDDL